MSEIFTARLLDQIEGLMGATLTSEEILALVDKITAVAPEDLSLSCHCARALFLYGSTHGNIRFLLLALDVLKCTEQKHRQRFAQYAIGWHLWGDILVKIGKHLQEPFFYEYAIQKYSHAGLDKEYLDLHFYRAWGEAWILLAQQTKEPADYLQGLAKFYQLYEREVRSPLFYQAYARALVLYGAASGDPRIIKEGISFHQKLLMKTFRPQQELSFFYLTTCREYALAYKAYYQCAHSDEVLEEANVAFQEAILASHTHKELWLDWGELLLQAGWLKKDSKIIEKSLDTLTSMKVQECDPVRTVALLGRGLVLFGLLTENIHMLKEGKKRIDAALVFSPEEPALLCSLGYAMLSLGLYFSDSIYLAEAAAIFTQRVESHEEMQEEALYALFHAYVIWGVHQGDTLLLEKGLHAMARLCALRPFSPLYLQEMGEALVKVSEEGGYTKEKICIYLEEAIDAFYRGWKITQSYENVYYWGYALNLLGDLVEDEELYAQALELLTCSVKEHSIDEGTAYQLAISYGRLGEYTPNIYYLLRAIDLLESLVKLDPEEEHIWYELGYTLLTLSETFSSCLQVEDREKARWAAERALLRAAELGSGKSCYFLACLYSLVGLYEVSILYLRKAKVLGILPTREELMGEEWLEGVRSSVDFQEFIIWGDKHGRDTSTSY